MSEMQLSLSKLKFHLLKFSYDFGILIESHSLIFFQLFAIAFNILFETAPWKKQDFIFNYI